MGAMPVHAWIDASAGVAGDMVLAALLDAGADQAWVQRAVNAVVPNAVQLGSRQVLRAGQRALKVDVGVLADDPPHRTWASIRRDLEAADLHPLTRHRALAVFERLATAEATVHGVDVEQVHFHEVGALDSIADVVGSCEALRSLGVDSVTAGPVALGSGRIRAVHGDIAVPVPAVTQLSIGWQVLAGTAGGTADPVGHAEAHHHGVGHHHEHAEHPGAGLHDRPADLLTPGQLGELATPTGMALIRALASQCEPLPALTVHAVGVGAGGKDTPGRPNVVRVVVGSPGDPPPEATEVVELTANVDDLDPRLWPGVIEALLGAGALDAWLVPILMKKGRPAHTLHVLTTPQQREAVTELIFRATTTLGVRYVNPKRSVLHRRTDRVTVDGTEVRLKVALFGDEELRRVPEFEDVRALAQLVGCSELEALARIVQAARLTSLSTQPSHAQQEDCQ